MKAVFVERFKNTPLALIKEPMYNEGKACWLNHLDYAMEKNKDRVHGTTNITPIEMVTDSKLIPRNKSIYKSKKQPKFLVGDYIRDPHKKNIYSKGYTTNWNRGLFKIHKINDTNPVTYTLEDENNEQIEGKYYEQELSRSVFNF